jgi:hypothetical protein
VPYQVSTISPWNTTKRENQRRISWST